jgi:cephalosporin hydroxylase
MWNLKPKHVIETGVARGGSLALSASLMEMVGNQSKVLGLDIQIFPHATEALKSWIDRGEVQLVESDSTSLFAINAVKEFLGNTREPVLLVLYSNHSHKHVLGELQALALMLPIGSVVIVADTIVEEMPKDYYQDRPWGPGNNPLTAVKEFLDLNLDFQIDQRWSRRSLIGECRDGILIRISN